MSNETKILSDLEVDDALVQDADYRFGPEDRQYIDNQIRGTQTHLVQSLIRGRHATFARVAATSANLVAGDAVCLASLDDGEVMVTKAVAAALGTAVAAFGVAVIAAAAGSMVLVAFGGAIPPSITGLSSGASGFVRVNTTTARCTRVESYSPGDYGIGVVDSAGYLQIIPGLGVGATGSGLTVAGNNNDVQIRNGTALAGRALVGMKSTTVTLTESELQIDADGVDTLVNNATGTINDVVAVDGNGRPVSRIRFTGAGAVTVTGFTGGIDKRRSLTIHNDTGNDLTLADENAGSSASNRIVTGSGGDFVLPATGAAMLDFDSGVSRWHLVSAAGTGGEATPGGADGDLQLNDGGTSFAGLGGDNGDIVRRVGDAWVADPGVEVAGAVGSVQVHASGGGLSGVSPGAEGEVLTVVGGAWASAPGGSGGGGAFASFVDATTGAETDVEALALDVSGWADGFYTVVVEAQADAGSDEGDVHGMSIAKRRSFGVRDGEIASAGAEVLVYADVVPSTTDPATADLTIVYGLTEIQILLDGEADTDLDWGGKVYREYVPAVSAGAGWGVGGGGGGGVFDPTAATLTGFYRGDFVSVPHSGTASAGSSSGKTLNSGSSGVGTGSNSIDSFDFNGSSDALTSDAFAGDHIGINGYRVSFLIKPDTVAAPGGNPYESEGVFSASNGNWGIAIDNTGGGRIVAYHYDGAYKTATQSIATGSFQTVDVVYDGAADELTVYVDGVAGTPTTGVGTLASVAAAGFNIGCNNSSSAFFDGEILDVITMDDSDGGMAQMTPAEYISYCNDRYALSI